MMVAVTDAHYPRILVSTHVVLDLGPATYLPEAVGLDSRVNRVWLRL